jgi:hypothetical protein
VVAVGGIVQGALLVDYADRGLVRPNPDFLNVFNGFAAGFHILMDLHRAFHRGLRVELGGKEILNSTFSIT